MEPSSLLRDYETVTRFLNDASPADVGIISGLGITPDRCSDFCVRNRELVSLNESSESGRCIGWALGSVTNTLFRDGVPRNICFLVHDSFVPNEKKNKVWWNVALDDPPNLTITDGGAVGRCNSCDGKLSEPPLVLEAPAHCPVGWFDASDESHLDLTLCRGPCLPSLPEQDSKGSWFEFDFLPLEGTDPSSWPGCAIATRTVLDKGQGELCLNACPAGSGCNMAVLDSIGSIRGDQFIEVCHRLECSWEPPLIENLRPLAAHTWKQSGGPGAMNVIRVFTVRTDILSNIFPQTTSTTEIPTTTEMETSTISFYTTSTTTRYTTTSTTTACFIRGIRYTGETIPLQPDQTITRLHDCQEACQQNFHCAAADWNANQLECTLKSHGGDLAMGSYTGIHVPLFCGNATDQEREQVSKRNLWSGVRFGFDVAGRAVLEFYSTDWHDCQLVCKMLTICQIYSYSIERARCYIKRLGEGAIRLIAAENVITGTWQPNVNIQNVDAIGERTVLSNICYQDNTEYWGGDLDNGYWVRSINDCRLRCVATPQCAGFSFNTVHNYCYMKWAMEGSWYNPTSISGHRTCAELYEVQTDCGDMEAAHGSVGLCERIAEVWWEPYRIAFVPYDPKLYVSRSLLSHWWHKPQTATDPEFVPLLWSDSSQWDRMGIAAGSLNAQGICTISDFTPKDISCPELQNIMFPLTVRIKIEVEEVLGENEADRRLGTWNVIEGAVEFSADFWTHHGFYFDYGIKKRWDVDLSRFATGVANVEVELVSGRYANVRELPEKPLVLLFCIWGQNEPFNHIFEAEPDKHAEICAPPIYLFPDFHK